MDERSKRKKRLKKKQRHEATKKRTRKSKMRESESAQHTGLATPSDAAHKSFMSKKRR